MNSNAGKSNFLENNKVKHCLIIVAKQIQNRIWSLGIGTLFGSADLILINTIK